MARKSDLRVQRTGTVINTTSKKQEKSLIKAMIRVEQELYKKFPGIKLDHSSRLMLSEVVSDLRNRYPEVDFFFFHKTSYMLPDGGILYLTARNTEDKYPILISEKKNQGTNDLRIAEGMTKQAKGNAIERLGKNVIGFRTALKPHDIFPFVCFGDGCDFSDDSSILDRVVTIAQFGKLNTEHVHHQGDGDFDRGSFYFRVPEWTEDEMFERCLSIAIKSVFHFFSRYGEDAFLPPK